MCEIFSYNFTWQSHFELLPQAQTAFYTAAFHAAGLEPSMVENFHKTLLGLQKELEARKTKFLHGDEPGLVDYTIWPFLERIEALPLIGKTEFALDKSKYDILVSNSCMLSSLETVNFNIVNSTSLTMAIDRLKGHFKRLPIAFTWWKLIKNLIDGAIEVASW